MSSGHLCLGKLQYIEGKEPLIPGEENANKATIPYHFAHDGGDPHT